MSLLSRLEVENFLCFRTKVSIPLSQGTYLIGVNNAGKTAVLSAIRFFFHDEVFSDESFLNKTAFLGKQEGATRTLITIEFDITALNKNSKLRRRLSKQFGKSVSVTKMASFKRDSGNITHTYAINGTKTFVELEELEEDVSKLLRSVRINYLHPQEGKELLRNAQEKLRTRLLWNWGRHSSLADQLKELQAQWDELRKLADKYLSSSLTHRLKDVWPGSKTTVNLPESVQDVIAISNINFQGDPALPEVQLTSQGTGAQSTILYLTHSLLDSDKTLHMGEYYPVWLLEEPESFLHSDLMVKMATKFSSPEWLSTIQMIVSTHSPIILATSRLGKDEVRWNIMDSHSLERSDAVTAYKEQDIRDIGVLMGDSNFYAYFIASYDKKLVFIEDTRELTAHKFAEAGIEVSEALNGVDEIKRYAEVYEATHYVVRNGAYFVIDGDPGKKALGKYMTPAALTAEKDGFRQYKIADGIWLIVLPEGEAVEEMFDEYMLFVEECLEQICDVKKMKMLEKAPARFSGVVSKLKANIGELKDKQQAVESIKNKTEIKQAFWDEVKKRDLDFNPKKAKVLRQLMEIE